MTAALLVARGWCAAAAAARSTGRFLADSDLFADLRAGGQESSPLRLARSRNTSSPCHGTMTKRTLAGYLALRMGRRGRLLSLSNGRLCGEADMPGRQYFADRVCVLSTGGGAIGGAIDGSESSETEIDESSVKFIRNTSFGMYLGSLLFPHQEVFDVIAIDSGGLDFVRLFRVVQNALACLAAAHGTLILYSSASSVSSSRSAACGSSGEEDSRRPGHAAPYRAKCSFSFYLLQAALRVAAKLVVTAHASVDVAIGDFDW